MSFKQALNHGYDSSTSTLTLASPPPLLIILKLSLECGGLCIVHAPGPCLLCTGSSERKNGWRTGFSRPAHYAVFSTRVIALDIHWVAGLWKTVTKSVVAETTYSTSGLSAASFFSVWLHKVLLKLQLCGVYIHAGLEGQTCYKNGLYKWPLSLENSICFSLIII